MITNQPTDAIREILRAHDGVRLRITWRDDKTWSVDVSGCDEDGFLHSGPEGSGQRHYWSRYSDVKHINTENVD